MFVMCFIHSVLTNMFRPRLLPSSECYKNTNVLIWLAVSASLYNNTLILNKMHHKYCREFVVYILIYCVSD